MDCVVVFQCILLLLMVVAGEIFGALVPSERTLRCYECKDSFDDLWTPYTSCQSNVTAVPVAICLESEKYCKVERVTVKGATISMTRGCADTCYYGCRLYGFGVTQLQCSSCCKGELCNVGSGAGDSVSWSRSWSSVAWSVTRGLVCAMLTVCLQATVQNFSVN